MAKFSPQFHARLSPQVPISTLYRCSSTDIQFDGRKPEPNVYTDVRLKPYADACNFLQYLCPLTPENPYFFVEVRSLSASSIVTLGISGPSMREDVHLGHYNNTVGYHSSTGLCISNHCSRTHTKPTEFGVGDIVGMKVTHFGDGVSCIMVVKNGQPVCTKYHYESNINHFLPTIALEKGPIYICVMWNTSAPDSPSFSLLNPRDWMLSSDVEYDVKNNIFCATSKAVSTISTLQGPQALTRENNGYEVELVVDSTADRSACFNVCLVAGGTLLPAPSSSLYRENLEFPVNPTILETGDRFGWCIQYLPVLMESGLAVQPIICCFMFNGSVHSSICYLEPQGGYFPFIVFTSKDFKVRLRNVSGLYPSHFEEAGFSEHLTLLRHQMAEERFNHTLHSDEFTRSSDIKVYNSDDVVIMTLAADKLGIHTLQYRAKMLTPGKCIFQVNIHKLSEDSVICVGLAGKSLALNKYPGRHTGSIGYHSRDGKILYDGNAQGNSRGHQFTQGDQILIDVCYLPESSHKVLVRFWKNCLPVAVRYITVNDTSDVFPTVSLLANGSDISCELITPNCIENPAIVFVNEASYWCLPEHAKVNNSTGEVTIPNPMLTIQCLVCPVPLSRNFHHFELELDQDPSQPGVVPPMIALTSASPYDPPFASNFKLDIVRFWPRNEASTMVKRGDNMGWGIVFPDDNLPDDEEQIVICYLTINRNVMLTRALIQPPGGFFPTVVVPYGCEKVKFNFGALTINSHPFTVANVQKLCAHAKQLIHEENLRTAEGADVPYERERIHDYYKPLPIINEGDNSPHQLSHQELSFINLELNSPHTNTAQRKAKHSKSRTCTLV